MKITAIVPMRHDSERVPGKNFKPFRGEPLYRHIVRTLGACPSISEVVIDTDSPVIMADAGTHFPGVRLLERPVALRDGATAMNEVLLNTVKSCDAELFV